MRRLSIQMASVDRCGITTFAREPFTRRAEQIDGAAVGIDNGLAPPHSQTGTAGLPGTEDVRPEKRFDKMGQGRFGYPLSPGIRRQFQGGPSSCSDHRGDQLPAQRTGSDG
jgi:hypothetical protein